MSIETVSRQLCHGGVVSTITHSSSTLGLDASFTVFQPGKALRGEAVPVLFLLAGLTCTHETFLQKSTIIADAAARGLMLVAPDTSPRGAGVAGEDDSYDLGTGAGFYLDATLKPWDRHYRMASYLSGELPMLVRDFSISIPRRSALWGIPWAGMGRSFMPCAILRSGSLSVRSLPSFILLSYLGERRPLWPIWVKTGKTGWRGMLSR